MDRFLKPIGLGCLSVLVLVVFLQTTQFKFTNYDEPEILTKNPDVLDEDLTGIFLRQSAFDYIPVTLATFIIEKKLAGLNPKVFHATNVALHLLNVLMVFWLVQLFTGGRTEVSLLVTSIFALHPFQVESVAWVTQRKNVLYTALLLPSWYYFEKYCRDKKYKYWLISIVLFVFSCGAKAAAISLPLLFLAGDYLMGRPLFQLRQHYAKAPFILINLAIIAAHKGVHGVEILTAERSFSYASIVWNFIQGQIFYLSKFIVPINLAAFYAMSAFHFELMDYLLFGLGLVAFVAAYFSRQSRPKLFGVLVFGSCILPASQIIPFGNYFLFGDRYMYVAIIGLAFLLAVSLREMVTKIHMVAVTGVLSLGMTAASYQRASVWSDSETLWRDTIEKYPETAMAYFNIAGARFFDENRLDGVEELYFKALTIKPEYPEALFNLGLYYNKIGEYPKAVQMFEEVIKKEPKLAKSYFNIGLIYYNLKQCDKAVPYIQSGLAIDPNNPTALQYLKECLPKKD